MAANSTGSNDTGRKLYYSVSFGKLSSREKNPPEGYTEINEATLKKNLDDMVAIDLRKRYINKATGDYPFKVFHDSITGTITGFEKRENDNGISLDLILLDTDGDTSIVQTKFYSKYTENVLNRLLNTTPNTEMTFFPYSIPGTFEVDGKNKEYYNQGVSIKVAGKKIELKYDKDNKDLPPTEQIQNAQGKMETSRVKRVNFLFDKFSAAYSNLTTPAPKPEQPKVDESKSFAPDSPNTDLPFA